jgi:uncharacterized protein YjbI with pentapeptide repeats
MVYFDGFGVLSMVEFPARQNEIVPLLNETGLVAFTIPFQVKPPQDSLTIVVKGTFDLHPEGTVTLSEEQDPPSGDLHYQDNAEGSLVYPSDFAIFKPKADVVLSGHAYPKGKSANQSLVSFRFGQRINKSIAVFGMRSWESMGGTTAPKYFSKIALCYEHAFGGPKVARNPVGLGHSSAGKLLPHLEQVNRMVASPSDSIDPACFAPIASSWKQRRDGLGTYNNAWLKHRWPFFPEDYLWSCQNAAPLDQQIDYPRGDEWFELSGVNKEHSFLQGTLPMLRPKMYAHQTRAAGDSFFEILLRLDTIVFRPDDLKVNLIWRGFFDVADDDAPDIAQLFLRTESGDQSLPLEEVRSLFYERYEAQDKPEEEVEIQEVAELEAPPVRQATMSREQALGLVASTQDLAGVDFTKVDLHGQSFVGKNLMGANFTAANLQGCYFEEANLEEAIFDKANVSEGSFQRANLTLASMAGANLSKCNFTLAVMNQTSLEDAEAKDSDFGQIIGQESLWVKANLSRSNFQGASLVQADFTEATVTSAKFVQADLRDATFYEAQAEGADFSKALMADFRANAGFFKHCTFSKIQASASVWDYANVSHAKFDRAVLNNASMIRIQGEAVVFNQCEAKEICFRKAKLRYASFLKSDMMTSSFEGANLNSADFRGANLFECEFWKSKRDQTNFQMAHLAGTKLVGGG